MQLPFSLEQFLSVFGAYNTAVWPVQIGLYIIGMATAVLAARGANVRFVVGPLVLLWAWMGGVYHLMFFAEINPAARIFGFMFLLQAALWAIWARAVPALAFQPDSRSHLPAGWGMMAYAFVAYPLLNVAFGHGYPAMPTFGAPCPTTIVTLGLLTWASPRPPWWVWVVPVAWALVGTSAAFTLGITEDLGLLVAAALALGVRYGGGRAVATA